MKMRSLLPAALLATGIAGGLTSCSEDFDVAAPAKPITVVYGVLDAGETTHYVRIQKAFADPKLSALDLAKVPDSSYFTNLAVTIQEITSAGVPTGTATALQKVKLSDEGLTKETGTFFSNPSYAYKFTGALTPGSTYRMLIKNLDDGHTDTATTPIVNLGSLTIRELNPILSPDQKFKIDPINTNVNPQVNGNYSWQVIQYPTSPTAKFLEHSVRFRYVDQDAQGQRSAVKTFDYRFTQTLRNDAGSWLAAPSNKFSNFYDAVNNYMGAAPAGITRLIDSTVDFISYFGSPDLYTFQQNQAALGGLAGDQIQYRYTNIKGNDVLGVLGSRASIIRTNVIMTPETITEFKTNMRTRDAKIVGIIK